MKKVRYVGALDAELPILGLAVKNGDVIEVEDNFVNGLFELVEDTKQKKDKVETKEDNN